MKGFIKRFILNTMWCVHFINKISISNKIRVRKKTKNICSVDCLLKDSRIDIRGSNNTLIIKKSGSFNKLDIVIVGNNNIINIDEDVFFRDAKILIEDDTCSLNIHRECVFAGDISMSVMEGTCLEIGEGCLFSKNIDIRTGDGHSVLNIEGTRTNPSENVSIGKHVWVGAGVSILKGVQVSADTIVATRSVLNKKYMQENVLLAGVPAKVVKEDVKWNFERI